MSSLSDVSVSSRYRLPRDVAPQAYRLSITPALGAATFEGTVEIDLEVVSPTSVLVANAAELAIDGATVTAADGTVQRAEVALDEEDERVTFTVGEVLGEGRAVLRCSFRGILNDQLRGFYRSTFVGEDGATHLIATTQMESTDARRAFPCWDEPDRKATFEITLVVDNDLAAFSNSPEAEVTDLGDGTRRIRYEPTMKMSTYLVAFVVGPFVATEPLDVDGVPVRIVSPPGRESQTAFPLEVAAHALRFFASYFDIPYPGEKLDLVAIPDFAFGAMENLGCVTFRETALLADPATSSQSELERVADVVCHELAHMWFGDLVTMGWWEGIWLNEAFATFMETMACDAFRPDWQRWVSFGIEREMALAVDALHSTRPIEYPVGPPKEAEGMLDVLTYQKGGSVLRMLEQFLGPDVFRDGIRRYLRAHAYANAVTADLWAALAEESGLPVAAIMDGWILQGGHPLVSLEGVTLSQRPFTFGPPVEGTDSAIGSLWQVPVLTRALEGTEADGQHILLGAEPIDVDPSPSPLVVNAGGHGVYRVAYRSHELAQLAAAFDRLLPLERATLVADTWSAVQAQAVEPADFFSLAANFGDEDEPATWTVLVGALGLCDRVLGEDARPAVAHATVALLGPRFDQLGFDAAPGEAERTPTLRALLLGALGTIGRNVAIRTEALARFDAAAAGGPALSPDLESTILGVVADQVRPGDFDTFVGRYRRAKNPLEERRYLFALAGFPEPALGHRVFEMATSEQVRTQDGPYLIASALFNRVGGPRVWQDVKEGWSGLLERFPDASHSRMVSGVRGLSADPTAAADAIEFLRTHPLASGQRSVTQTLERLANAVAFGERHRATLPAVLLDAAAR
jgi:puromycin-sensitive aminopeptidase